MCANTNIQLEKFYCDPLFSHNYSANADSKVKLWEWQATALIGFEKLKQDTDHLWSATWHFTGGKRPGMPDSTELPYYSQQLFGTCNLNHKISETQFPRSYCEKHIFLVPALNIWNQKFWAGNLHFKQVPGMIFMYSKVWGLLNIHEFRHYAPSTVPLSCLAIINFFFKSGNSSQVTQ